MAAADGSSSSGGGGLWSWFTGSEEQKVSGERTLERAGSNGGISEGTFCRLGTTALAAGGGQQGMYGLTWMWWPQICLVTLAVVVAVGRLEKGMVDRLEKSCSDRSQLGLQKPHIGHPGSGSLLWW
jgi:hypothetical protein